MQAYDFVAALHEIHPSITVKLQSLTLIRNVSRSRACDIRPFCHVWRFVAIARFRLAIRMNNVEMIAFSARERQLCGMQSFEKFRRRLNGLPMYLGATPSFAKLNSKDAEKGRKQHHRHQFAC